MKRDKRGNCARCSGKGTTEWISFERLSSEGQKYFDETKCPDCGGNGGHPMTPKRQQQIEYAAKWIDEFMRKQGWYDPRES